MNRREFMDKASVKFLCSPKSYGEIESAFKQATKLGAVLDERGYFTKDETDELSVGALFIINTSIDYMSAHGGDWGDPNTSVNKAVGLFNLLENPKSLGQSAQVAGQNALGISNPGNLPIYGPGGQLQISGIPQMPSFPAGPTQPTQGIMGDSAIQHSSFNPAQPAG